MRAASSGQGSAHRMLRDIAVCVVNHSEVVNGGGVHLPNISHGGSSVNNPMGQNPLIHLFSDPYEYELVKLLREEEKLKKSFEETTSELMAELERKMAEVRSEYERESKELDAAYNAQAREEEVNRCFVETSSLLGNAFVWKFSQRSESSTLI